MFIEPALTRRSILTQITSSCSCTYLSRFKPLPLCHIPLFALNISRSSPSPVPLSMLKDNLKYYSYTVLYCAHLFLSPFNKQIKRRQNLGKVSPYSVQNISLSNRKHCHARSYSFAFGSVWVRNLVSDIKGTHTEGVRTECWREYLKQWEIKWREGKK
jgi:hypothetical protein